MTDDTSTVAPITRAAIGERISCLDVDQLEQTVESMLVEAGAATTDAPNVDLAAYLNEATVALELIGDRLRPDARILEVGSGIGFFAHLLRQHGYDSVDFRAPEGPHERVDPPDGISADTPRRIGESTGPATTPSSTNDRATDTSAP